MKLITLKKLEKVSAPLSKRPTPIPHFHSLFIIYSIPVHFQWTQIEPIAPSLRRVVPNHILREMSIENNKK